MRPVGSIVGRVMLVRQNKAVHGLRNDALRKISYDQLRCNDDGWIAELYYLNQFWYDQKEDTSPNEN